MRVSDPQFRIPRTVHESTQSEFGPVRESSLVNHHPAYQSRNLQGSLQHQVLRDLILGEASRLDAQYNQNGAVIPSERSYLAVPLAGPAP